MGDVEDVEIYAAEPIYAWQQTDQGQWIMEHCPDPQFRLINDEYAWGYSVNISGPLNDQDAVYFKLKWGVACPKS